MYVTVSLSRCNVPCVQATRVLFYSPNPFLEDSSSDSSDSTDSGKILFIMLLRHSL